MIRAVYGQGGKNRFFSGGMISLVNKLRAEFPDQDVFDDIEPTVTNANADAIRGHIVSWRKQYPKSKVIFVLYSLGCNLGSLAQSLITESIDLIVAYDPTHFAPVWPLGPHVKRTICYRCVAGFTPGAIFGHRALTGHNVELINVPSDHWIVQWQYWDETIHAVRKALWK